MTYKIISASTFLLYRSRQNSKSRIVNHLTTKYNFERETSKIVNKN